MSGRAALLLSLAALAALAPGVGPAEMRAFEAANRRFTEAAAPQDFLAVAALYQEILDGGVHSGAVLFNQGNAYARAGERGRAIACYRQAERLRARDPLLAGNLQHVLASAGAPPRQTTLLDHVLFWRRWLAYREKVQLVALLAGAAFLCGLAALWRGRGWRRAAWTCLALCLLAGAPLLLDARDILFTEHGVVVVPEAVARKGNSESFAPAFTEPLREGAEFVVLERRDGWARIALEGALDGWIRVDDAVFY